MAAYKDYTKGYDGKTWRVAVYYKDWRGIQKKHEKRGFKTKKAALAYEREFLSRVTKDPAMSFDTFLNIYLDDIRPQIKASTYATKVNILEKHIRPYFKSKSLSEISATDILQWQNSLLSQRDDSGRGYSMTYLRTVNNQLSAVFNHAVRYYELPKNPCLANKKMGKANASELNFWTTEEYRKFADAIKDKPMSYYMFQILYWCGIREGELLALTAEDFNLEKGTLRINKTWQIVNGKEMVTDPKTEASNRVVDMPDFLCREMEDYFASIYKLDRNSRLFPVTKYYLYHEMQRGSAAAGVQRIRVHDLRHSHVSLLINLGFSAVAIGRRVGHESVTITQRYAHMFPSEQQQMVKKLDLTFADVTDNENISGAASSEKQR